MNWEMHGRMARSHEFWIPRVLVSTAWIFRKASPWVTEWLLGCRHCSGRLLNSNFRAYQSLALRWSSYCDFKSAVFCQSLFFHPHNPWGAPPPHLLEAPSCALHGIIFGWDVPYTAEHHDPHVWSGSPVTSSLQQQLKRREREKEKKGKERRSWNGLSSNDR